MREFSHRIAHILTLVALIATAVWAQGGEVVNAGEVRLQKPAGWFVAGIPADKPHCCGMLASQDSGREQAILLISRLTRGGEPLATLVSMNRRYIVLEMDGVVEFERTGDIAGCPAHTFVYEGRSEYSSLGRRKFIRTIVQRGNEFYIFQGVADHLAFVRHAGTLEGMINSITWNQH